jgi:hypothetical protein
MFDNLNFTAIVECLVVFLLAFVLPISAGIAQPTTCPEVSVDLAQINADTQDSLAELERRFASYSIGINLLDERNSMLVEFPFTDQKLFIDVFYARYCRLIERSNITLSAKTAQLEEARSKLYQKASFGDIVADTRTQTQNQSNIFPYLKWVRYAGTAAQPVNPGGLTHRVSASHPGASAGWLADSHNPPGAQTDYIREPPFVVTRANKHFVMVASTPSFESAVDEMNRLKRKAPQYDFVVYAPYGSNPNYAIMMAAWVPYDLAKRVLKLAKREVNPGSIIWSCRHEGNQC